MTDSRKPHVIVLRVAAVLLVLAVVSTSMVAGRFARYISTATYESGARVARFNIIDESSMSTDVPAFVYPGSQESEAVVVKNYSEVSVEFTLRVECVGDNLPLFLQLKARENGEETLLTETSGGDNALSYCGIIGPNQRQLEYVVYIRWPEEYNDPNYMGMVDVLRVSVDATQVD